MKVKINDMKWKISWVGKEREELFCDDVKCLGVTYFDRRHIFIDKGQTWESFEKTAIHELTHAFLYEFGVDLNDPNDDVAETVCYFTENHCGEMLKLADKIVKAWGRERLGQASEILGDYISKFENSN